MSFKKLYNLRHKLSKEKLKNTATKARNVIPTKAQANNFAGKTKKSIDSTLKSVNTEVRESKDMALLFFRLLEKNLDINHRKEPPSEEEVKAAIEQLKDVGRISVFASISIIPGGGFSLIGLEMLAKKYGIKNFTFVPSSFRKKKAEIVVSSTEIIKFSETK